VYSVFAAENGDNWMNFSCYLHTCLSQEGPRKYFSYASNDLAVFLSFSSVLSAMLSDSASFCFDLLIASDKLINHCTLS